MNKEQWSAIGMFIVSVVTMYESTRLGIGSPGTPQSGAFPLILGICLCATSILFFVNVTLRMRAKRSWDDTKSEGVEEPEAVVEGSYVNWRKVLLSLVAVAAYPLLFLTVGFIAGTTVFLLFLCKFVERLKILTTAIIIIVTIGVSYSLFVILLKVPLR